MTATTPARRARTPVPEVEFLSVGWRRIQVLLRIRPPAGFDASRLRLRHATSSASVQVTGWEAEDGAVLLRFNVMQGPDRRPLRTGRWQLTLAGPRGGRGDVLRLAGKAVAGEASAKASFVIEQHGTYDAVASVSASGTFAIDVTIDPTLATLDYDVVPGGSQKRGPVGHALIALRLAMFSLTFRLMRLVTRRNGRRILFSSDSRIDLAGNQKLVYDRMVERGLDREFELLTLFRSSIADSRSMRDRLRLPRLLARVDTVVIDDYQPVIYRVRDPDVTIIQLWHAVGAFKTVGYSRVGKPGAPDPYKDTHKNYRWATVSARDDIPVYAEAFGIPESHVVATGVPRVDPMFEDDHREASLAAVARAYPETVGRTVILFAPTFRGSGARTASYDNARVDVEALHALCVERDAVCLIRLHPFVREPIDIPEAFRDRMINAPAAAEADGTAPIETNDLLFAVDLLVTDYSSIVYEYSILGRPMLFFAYDLDDYVASRDFYEPFESFVPGRIVHTFDELLDAIRREDYQLEKVGPFARRHFDHLDGGSTDRVIDLITAR